MTPREIDAYLRDKGSPLAGKGAVFVREGRRNGIDPALLVAISGAESSFGTQVKAGTHNPFGWGPHIPFKSWDQAITTVAAGLRKGYFDEGLKTIAQIGAKWAPSGAANDPTNLNSNWARNVGRFYSQLGGQGVTAKPNPRVAPLAPAATLDTTSPLPANAPDLTGLALANLAQIAGGGRQQSPLDMLSGLTSAVASQPPPLEPMTLPAPQMPGTPTPAAPGGDWRKWVGPIEHRAGPSKPHTQAILQFVGKVGQVAGTVLTPWGNESHSLTTVDHNRSAHADGMAADIPATGSELIRLGQDALIAAGMPAAQARKQRGGLFNVGNHQVIFATDRGGNHWDHVHVGIRR